MKRYFLLLFFTGCLFSQAIGAKESYWPRVIKFEQGSITLYQPQPESLKGNILHGRAAVMVKQKKEGEPVFGAFWFDADMFTDRDARIVTLESIAIRNIKFPEEMEAGRIEQITSILENEIPNMSLEFQLDELLATIEETNKTGEEGLNNDPPEIIVRYGPAVLITVDGEPRTESIEGSEILQVVNTPYFIAFDPKYDVYWLYGDGMWFRTTDVLHGSWTYEKNPPYIIKDLIDESEIEKEEVTTLPPIPEIIVRSTPAELIVTEGEPEFVPIEGSGLLYVKNTQSDVFMNTNDQSYYILLTGRWYVSRSMRGPWAYVPADRLPQEFAAIPEGSEKDRVLASIAGTDAANEAVLDAIIPQTASVKRNEATVEVTYDGNPNFVNIPGTRVAYADNSGTTVLLISNRFYACDNGIWFESDRADGPWMVCVNVPADVRDIPPSSPVHNVKYVYVYDYTPDIVYVGYTPGYMGSYVYGPTVVYGTGFYYHSWYGRHYYPRPWTYGYHMYYDPYTGWVIGFYTPYWRPYSWYTCYYSHPRYRYHYYGGYWGPPAYPPPYHYYYHHYYGSHATYPVAYYHDHGNRPPQNVYYQHRTGVESSRRTMSSTQTARSNDYTRRTETGSERVSTSTSSRTSTTQPSGRPTTTSRTTTGQPTSRPTTRQSTRNNVYTDRDGQVYRRTDQEWEKRTNNTWQPAPQQSTNTKPANTTNTRQTTNTRPSSNGSQSNLDRQQYNRERGEQRSNNAQVTRSTSNTRSSTTKTTTRSRTSTNSGSQSRTANPNK
jgi:hypothetical protein